ncbi:MAG: iron-containing alcohol dehydrogenase, partial [Planctomycetota bacterium]
MSDAAVVAVGLGDRSYEVRIGAGLLAGAGDAIEEAMGGGFGRCLVVIDTGAAAHAAALVESLRARGTVVTEVEVEPSETDKSLETFARLVTAAANAELERGDPVIAVGGGIVGDIAGFAAASYRRGVPVVQCPT